MRWYLKAVMYATLLTWPGQLLAPVYQKLLLAITGALTGQDLRPPADGSVDLSAANLLSVYVALCLASDFTTWPRRARALAVGIPVLVAIECATGVLGMNLARATDAASDGLVTAAPLLAQALELSRWLAVPLLWGVMIGRLALAADASARVPKPDRAPGPAAATGRRR